MSSKEWLWNKAVGWLARPMAAEVLHMARPHEAAAGANTAPPRARHEAGDGDAR